MANGRLEINPGELLVPFRSRKRLGLLHLLELRSRGHLLAEQRGLNAVEKAFEPADQLRLGYP